MSFERYAAPYKSDRKTSGIHISKYATVASYQRAQVICSIIFNYNIISYRIFIYTQEKVNEVYIFAILDLL